MSERALRVSFAALGAVLLGTLFLSVAAPRGQSAEKAPAAGVVFISPWPGALIMDGPVVIAGRLPPGSGRIHFLLNGRVFEGITRNGDSFSGAIKVETGFNELEVRGEDSTSRLAFIYGSRTPGEPVYSFHAPLVEGTCDPCHRERRGGPLTEAALCSQCHGTKSIIYPYVHGPVAAGKCLICHDAHGSIHPALSRVKVTEMCTSCHDQLSTKEHTTTSRSKVCTLCHDPHYGMNRAMLRATF